MEVDFQPDMIGRDEELKELEAYLEKAINGEGNTVFISGEAGIGKTRLVNELGEIARSRGFQVLTGHSMHESLTPYMPFLDALRSGGLESLFAEEAPRIEAIYLVTHGGVLVSDVVRMDSDLNPALFTSMLTAVGNFVKDSFFQLEGEETQDTMSRLTYGDHEILVERGENTNLVVILTGMENEFLIEDMREALSEVHSHYGKELDGWDGDVEKVEGTEEFLKPLITSGKYDGIYYGKDDSKARRNLLFENVSLGIIRQTQKEPTVLCIEDLQWVDPSSLALMHYVARNARKSGLLMLGTFRPEDIAVADGKGHPLIDAMQLMNREDLYEKIELQRLPRESLDGFLSSMFGDHDFDDDFKDLIYKETEGNPLFIIELMKLLVEERIAKRDNGTWRLEQELERVDLPSKVYDVIARRLNRVEEKDREILEYASVIGEIFNSKTLADALAVETVQLLERLRILERTHRLIRSSNGTYSFDHAKVKEVLYSEIPAELRAERHRSVAQSIEKLNENDLDEVLGDLAFHYTQSGNKEKAISYLTKAAEKAKEEYSNEEAIRFYTQALEFEEDKRKRMEILVALGDICVLIGEYGKGVESYEKALKCTTKDRMRAGIKAKIGDIHWKRGEYDDSIRISTEARNLVMDKESKEEAHSLYNIGIVHELKGEYDRALEFFEKSLGIREKIGDQEGIANSLNNIGIVHELKGEYDRALEFYDKSLGIFEKIGSQWGTAISLNNIGNVHHRRGEYDRALEFYDKSRGISEKIGDQSGIGACLNNIGIVHYQRGEYDRALEFFEKSRGIREKIGDQSGIGACLNNIGNVHDRRGEYDRALEFYEKSLGIWEKIGDQEGIATSLVNIGIVHYRRGEYDKALEFYKRSLETAKRIGFKNSIILAYISISRVDAERNDLEEALEFCNQAHNLSSELGQKNTLAVSESVLGTIFREQRKWKESIENFEKSIEILGRIGQKHDLAESYYEFGMMWRKKGDNEKAIINLNKSLETFEKLKLDHRVREVKVAIESLDKKMSLN